MKTEEDELNLELACNRLDITQIGQRLGDVAISREDQLKLVRDAVGFLRFVECAGVDEIVAVLRLVRSLNVLDEHMDVLDLLSHVGPWKEWARGWVYKGLHDAVFYSGAQASILLPLVYSPWLRQEEWDKCVIDCLRPDALEAVVDQHTRWGRRKPMDKWYPTTKEPVERRRKAFHADVHECLDGNLDRDTACVVVAYL